MPTVQRRVSPDRKNSYRALVRLRGHKPKTATFYKRPDAVAWDQVIEARIRQSKNFPGRLIEPKKYTLNELIVYWFFQQKYFIILQVVPSSTKITFMHKILLSVATLFLGSYLILFTLSLYVHVNESNNIADAVDGLLPKLTKENKSGLDKVATVQNMKRWIRPNFLKPQTVFLSGRHHDKTANKLLVGAIVIIKGSLNSSDLRQVQFEGADLSKADLSESNLTQANLSSANQACLTKIRCR